METPTRIYLHIYRKDVKHWPQKKFGCESISDNQHGDALDTPEILSMLISILPGLLMNRWDRKVQNIRRRELRESDLTNFVQFVEEETLLMNDPLFL